MKVRVAKLLVVASLSAHMALAHAEDIDLFVGVPAEQATDLPNVLFVVDNTANWGSGNNPQPFTNLKAALAATLDGLPENRFRVGIMFYNETGNPNNNVSGGYVRAAIRNMDRNTKQLYRDLVNSLDPIDDRGNGAIGSLVMAEAWYYYSGARPHAGNEKIKADFTGNTHGTNASRAVYGLPGNALGSFAGPRYNSPVAEGSCANNFIIYISNGASTDNNSVRTLSNNLLAAAGGNTATIPLSPSGLQDNPIDEWSRFMKRSNLGITTYTIEINPVTNGQGPNWTAVMRSVANVSGGKYFPVSSSSGNNAAAADIADAVNRALSEIQAVNSVYASVSLPVSVNTQGTFLNQVFIGMFRPAQGALPRWDGNLKQYKLGYYPTGSNILQTLDANSQPAINSATGFIAECARSFWTPTTTDTYWTNIQEQQCLATSASASSNSPDGNMVEKGGQGYLLRATSPSSRNLLVLDSSNSLTPINSAPPSPAAMGAADDAERNLLVNWIRGFNNRPTDAQDNFISSATAMRPSAHGDVVHSRPVAINYGTDTAPDVRVFYGANDGMLRAVNGNRNGGSELWAFLPREFYGKVKRLRENSQAIYYPGMNLAGATRKDYGFDGPIAAYQAKTNVGDPSISTAWIYAAMRRGGRSLYAFNVSNPASPSLLWRIGCQGTSCTAGYESLGQTWASPAVVTASGFESGSKPVLLMGGGYDSCEDVHPHTCDSSSNGNRLYVINGQSGALLKSFTTQRGIVADVTPVKDPAGNLKYGYTADMGGNVYRLSGPDGAPIGTTPPANWELTRIASLGCDTATSTCGNRNRKFLYAPDVVLQNDTYHLLVGSGDREKPLGDASDVDNYFFMLKDRPTDSTWLPGEAGNCSTNMLCMNSLLAVDQSETVQEEELNTRKGWYLKLNPREQVVTSAITVFGTTTFSTHEPTLPQPGQCSNNLGIARVYNVKFATSNPVRDTRSEPIPGGGLPPSPVAGMVLLDDGNTVPFLIGGDSTSPLAGREPESPALGGAPKGRIYWNIEQ
ncbi:pilus assembly protein [Pseudomonas sp.]|uniref:pilus assembly protein n=1 Tax=Pseudomonas sp. TaxID=306 RepID=UPI00272C2B0B|nr:PilC/PilY family type IV pilus protein [Pseudomonas sp.]